MASRWACMAAQALSRTRCFDVLCRENCALTLRHASSIFAPCYGACTLTKLRQLCYHAGAVPENNRQRGAASVSSAARGTIQNRMNAEQHSLQEQQAHQEVLVNPHVSQWCYSSRSEISSSSDSSPAAAAVDTAGATPDAAAATPLPAPHEDGA